MHEISLEWYITFTVFCSKQCKDRDKVGFAVKSSFIRRLLFFFLLSNHLFDCFNSVRILDWLFFYPIVSILSLYGNLVVFCSLFSLPTSFSIIISIYEDIFFICFLFLRNFWWMEFFFFFVVVPKCGCYYWHFVLVASAFSGELYKEIVVTPLRLIRFKLHWIQQMRFSML